MNYKKITLSLATIFSLTSLNAYEMKPVGFKATGMGGAGVASSRGSLATYYNPALVGLRDYDAEISLNLGIGIRENKLIDTVDQLEKLGLTDTVDRIAANAPVSSTNTQTDKDNIQTAQDILNKIPAGNGLQVTPSLSIATQFSEYFAIGAYFSAEIRANMVIDKNRLNIIVKDENTGNYFSYDPVNDAYTVSTEASYTEKSLQYALEGDKNVQNDSTTYLNVSAISIAEVPISFAYPIEQDRGILSLGITVKPMSVETFTKNFDIDTKSTNISDEYDKNKKTYTSIGVDLGLAYQEKNTGLILAVVGKNINNPTFKTEALNGKVETFELKPFFRAGISLPVWNDNIEFALDADLQQSDTTYEGMKSQYVGGGIELHPTSWFSLRAGLMKNIASESIDEGLIYTAGFGFGLKWFQFDLSAQVSQNTGRYDGDDIPKYANVNLSLVSKWGDEYNRKGAPIEEDISVEELEKDLENVNNLTSDEQKALNKFEKDRIQQDSKNAHDELDKNIQKEFGL